MAKLTNAARRAIEKSLELEFNNNINNAELRQLARKGEIAEELRNATMAKHAKLIDKFNEYLDKLSELGFTYTYNFESQWEDHKRAVAVRPPQNQDLLDKRFEAEGLEDNRKPKYASQYRCEIMRLAQAQTTEEVQPIVDRVLAIACPL